MDDAYVRITRLLERLKEQRAAQDDATTPRPKESGKDRILTLRDGVYKNLSAMLKARFDFGSRWEDVYLSQTWLSLSDIENHKGNAQLAEWIALRRENWDHVPPESVAADQCAVFGYNPYEPEETYLVWSEGADEPAVWRYYGGDSYFFHNLENFLAYAVGDREEDDSTG
jgi:hypothetical protein